MIPLLSFSQGLEELKLNKNQISDCGLKLLLKQLKKQKIEKLDLRNNSLKEPSLDYLISFSKYNKHLKEVKLQNNQICFEKSQVQSKINFLKKKKINVVFK